MPNFKLRIEYDGTDFHGWQKQRGLRTVQGLIEDALESIVQVRVPIFGAGRTDAGVHALGQVCNFVADTPRTPTQLGGGLSSRLPEDIQIREVQEVDPKFHARFSATGRRYVYNLRTEPSAIGRRYAHVVTYPLDLEAMQQAADLLIGKKDFTSFTPTRWTGVPPTCDLRELTVDEKDDVIAITVRADHFLHNMVRVIVGTLIEVGRGHWQPEHMEAILCKKDRGAAGRTVPPNGLFLAEVEYDL